MKALEKGTVSQANAALHQRVIEAVRWLDGFLGSLSSSFDFARRCEQEFHRTGRIDADALSRITRETAARR